MATIKPVIVWFRQDLRLQDNEAINAAIDLQRPIILVYIKEEDSSATWRVGQASAWWLHHALNALAKDLKGLGLKLILRKGVCLDELLKLIQETSADTLFWNRCYEPYSIKRDSDIKRSLKSQDVDVKSFNASLLVEPWEVSTKQKKPFQVFTPFFNACLKFEVKKPVSLSSKPLISYSKSLFSENLADLNLLPKIPWDKEFKNSWQPGESHAEEVLKKFILNSITSYEKTRDRPDLNGVSHFSPYLHFGNLSPRLLYERVKTSSACFLRQIFWREFAYHLMYHFPYTTNKPLRKEFMNFPWINDKIQLQRWQKGLTGYPLVDAGMRELWTTGWMHNRVRMVTGSFLVKDLLINWQEGAKWFFDTLVDADLANNTLGWQWVSGCGADAAPYFRIFNPITQSEKFDPEGVYIKKWVPELKNMPKKWIHKPFLAPQDVLESAGVILGKTYPQPIVDHREAREEALTALKKMKELR